MALQVSKINASSIATSDASFEAVARMRKQECILMSEIDRLRAERTVAENERVRAETTVWCVLMVEVLGRGECTYEAHGGRLCRPAGKIQST